MCSNHQAQKEADLRYSFHPEVRNPELIKHFIQLGKIPEFGLATKFRQQKLNY